MTIDPVSAIYLIEQSEPSVEAHFREEYYSQPRHEAPAPERPRTTSSEERLIRARNTVRIGRFIRLV